jgi:AraC family transcriptional regulator of adaptative response/methylated-DNA-[protein]-cysteine methyltransferase
VQRDTELRWFNILNGHFDINLRIAQARRAAYCSGIMLNEHVLWTAVEARDAQWDGVFVYAVRSTRIYCRPTCASRRPRRDGVQFFATAGAAAAAGFRACRRCAPDGPVTVAPHIERIRRACATIAERHDERLSLSELAGAVGGSAHHLLRTFKQTLGISPREYADSCRIGCLKAGLRTGDGVAAATYAAGYGSASRVYERASSALGMTPASYARGATGESVRYVCVDSPLGRLLVAATPRGICSVKIGGSDKTLENELKEEFPLARISPEDTQLGSWVSHIVESLAHGAPDARLPTDVRATAFQRLVWRELTRIPRGSTRSYQDVARRIGRPTAARAVARACAANPVALVVPCHRVVRGDGTAGGYRWGRDRKRALLESERSR